MSTLPCFLARPGRHRPRPGACCPWSTSARPEGTAVGLSAFRFSATARWRPNSVTPADFRQCRRHSLPPLPRAADATSKFCLLCTPGWAPHSRPPLRSWATSRSAGRSCRPCPARWAAWQVRRSSGNSGASGGEAELPDNWPALLRLRFVAWIEPRAADWSASAVV